MTTSRYDRQQKFRPIGEAGQQSIQAARVLIIGAGALGSVVVEILARAGVGYIRLIDRDFVETSNLQRQALYTESDAKQGLAKVEAAARAIQRVNSEIEIDPVALDITAGNIGSVAEQIDIIVDATDNFETRFLLNDFSLEHSIPWVHGGCIGASGQVFLFIPGETICLRCLIPNPPAPGTTDTCETAGVLGPATHVIASIQAGEVLRYLVLGKEAARTKILAMDLWSMRWREIETGQLRFRGCPACELGKRDFLQSTDRTSVTHALCGRNAIQISPPLAGMPLSLEKLVLRWGSLGPTESTRFLARLRLNDITITVFKDGRAVISGTEDPVTARSIYAKYVGN